MEIRRDVIMTATAVVYFAALGGVGASNVIQPEISVGDKYPLPLRLEQPYDYDRPSTANAYIAGIEGVEISDKLNVIAEFVEKLIKNSVELEPEFRKVLVEDFWDLI